MGLFVCLKIADNNEEDLQNTFEAQVNRVFANDFVIKDNTVRNHLVIVVDMSMHVTSSLPASSSQSILCNVMSGTSYIFSGARGVV
jgi:hypothetical protein